MSITYKQTPNTTEDIDHILNPLIKQWFYSRFKEYSLPQLHGVMEIHSRNNILISAPTGATKTLTGFMAILNELVDSAEKGILQDKVYCVYISPLKALNEDIKVNLVAPLEQIEAIAGKKLGIRVSVRTGDTTATEKSKMLSKPPHILITTPESLAIMLSSVKFRDHLKGVSWCILDEIHALAENKRGVHLSLSVERLHYLSPDMTRVGLSATVAPLKEIAKYLVGYHFDEKKQEWKENDCKIVDVQFIKELDLQVISPTKDLINMPYKDLHNALYELVHKLVQEHKTTLIFTNTRAATERVVHYLKEMYPKNYFENIGAHHGSLSKEHRHQIEQNLRDGKLKVVVCSTSLELGIDIGYIDLVICLGSPKSVARAVQRCLPYNAEILCSDGAYRKIGDIVERKLPTSVISYDKKKGYIHNKIKIVHKNNPDNLVVISLENGEKISCTKEHPLLTHNGWKKAINIKKDDLIAKLRNNVIFERKQKYLFELLPQHKIFVANRNNFFQNIVDGYIEKNKISSRLFAKQLGMPYSRFIDCRRLKGRKKSVRLDYFLKACALCDIPKKQYISYLSYLKTKGRIWTKLPLTLTKEFMWLAGIIATDGCIVENIKGSVYYKIKIGNKSRVLIDKVREIGQMLGVKPYQAYIKGLYHIEFGSNLFAYLLMSLGIPCKRKSFNLEINNNVYSLGSDLIYAYLEGIFEGDGNVTINKNKLSGMVRIFTASKKFAYGLHTLFSRLGYENKISKNRIKRSKLIKNVSNKYIYCIGIFRKEDIKGFFEKIPCYGEKAKKGNYFSKYFTPYLTLRKNYNRFLTYSKISKVRIIRNNKHVYNLTLQKEPNNFIVKNIVVHNCGRAGHQLHSTTKGRIIVLDRDDLVECSVLLKSAVEKRIDKIQIPKGALDVLIQHIFGMALEQDWEEKELALVIKQSYCYNSLSLQDFNEILDYLAGKFISLEDRHVYAKIWRENGKIGRRGKMSRVIYMTNIGTIPDQTGIKVKIGEKVIGTIDEGFLEKLKKRDVFVLGGNTYEFRFARGMTASVEASIGKPPTVPSWVSEMLPLSFDLAIEIGKFRRLMLEKFTNKQSKEEIMEFINEYLYVDKNAAEAIYSYFDDQYKYVKIMPTDKLILVEHYNNKEGDHKIIFHTLFGRRVNDVLSRAVGFAIGRTQHRDVEIGINDNGFYVNYEKKVDALSAFKLLKHQKLRLVMENALATSEVLRRRFRHCAGRALMILRNYMGHQKNVGRQQVSSMLLLNTVRRISENFCVLKEARREVLEDLMDIEHAEFVLSEINNKNIIIKEIQTTVPSPFAFNLALQGVVDILKMEDKTEFLRKIHEMVRAKIALGNKYL